MNDLQIAQELVELLKQFNLKITTAESCTGGMISAAITSVAGSSAVFELGICTYSNEQKMKLLGVREQTLIAHGAVSGETVTEMAKNAATLANADISIATSGIAGPGGGSKDKPVGTVWTAICMNGEVFCQRHMFNGTRASIRTQTTDEVLQYCIQLIKKKYGENL